MSHCVLFRVGAAWPRLGRAFRTAPVSRQTNPNPVWHSPRFHSRPATLLRAPFCPLLRSGLFFPAAAQVKKKTSRKRREREKTMKLEEIKNRTKDAVDHLVHSLEYGVEGDAGGSGAAGWSASARAGGALRAPPPLLVEGRVEAGAVHREPAFRRHLHGQLDG